MSKKQPSFSLSSFFLLVVVFAVLHENGEIETRTIGPIDFGLPTSSMLDLKGGDAIINAAAIRALLDGETSAYRDIVLANTAAILHLHSSDLDLKAAVKIAQDAIDSGQTKRLLQTYIEMTNG